MDTAILLYDGDCPMCRRARDWVDARRDPGLLELMPCQSDDREARAPQVSEADCLEAMQLVMPDGTVHAGEQAFAHLFGLLKRGRWRGWVFRVPGAHVLAAPVYRLIARNRMHLSGFFLTRVEHDACRLDEECK